MLIRLTLIFTFLFHGTAHLMHNDPFKMDIHQAFFKAVKNDEKFNVYWALKKDKNLVKFWDKSGRKAIHLATSKLMIDILLSFGAGIDDKDTEGMTALHLSVWYFDEELALFLLVKGANPISLDNNYRSPLNYASSEISETLFKALTKPLNINAKQVYVVHEMLQLTPPPQELRDELYDDF